MVVRQTNRLCAWTVLATKLAAAQLEVECNPFLRFMMGGCNSPTWCRNLAHLIHEWHQKVFKNGQMNYIFLSRALSKIKCSVCSISWISDTWVISPQDINKNGQMYVWSQLLREEGTTVECFKVEGLSKKQASYNYLCCGWVCNWWTHIWWKTPHQPSRMAKFTMSMTVGHFQNFHLTDKFRNTFYFLWLRNFQGSFGARFEMVFNGLAFLLFST